MKYEEDFEREYDDIVRELEVLKQNKVSKLKKKFANKQDFKIGEIIYNVTGIIKIESIDFSIGYNGHGVMMPINVEFKGTKYKWVKGGLITPTKGSQKGKLSSCGNLKKIDKSKVI